MRVNEKGGDWNLKRGWLSNVGLAFQLKWFLQFFLISRGLLYLYRFCLWPHFLFSIIFKLVTFFLKISCMILHCFMSNRFSSNQPSLVKFVLPSVWCTNYNQSFTFVKACVRYFLTNFYLWNFYLTNYVSIFPFFSPCQPLL